MKESSIFGLASPASAMLKIQRIEEHRFLKSPSDADFGVDCAKTTCCSSAVAHRPASADIMNTLCSMDIVDKFESANGRDHLYARSYQILGTPHGSAVPSASWLQARVGQPRSSRPSASCPERERVSTEPRVEGHAACEAITSWNKGTAAVAVAAAVTVSLYAPLHG